MITKILSNKNINAALEFLLEKPNSCGVDGLMLYDLDEYLKSNIQNIRESIYDRTYTPIAVKEIETIGRNGKKRVICILGSLDRLLLRAIHQVLREMVSSQFSPCSFAFQEGKGTIDAVRHITRFIDADFRYVVNIDIKDFFDSIEHECVLRALRQLGIDNQTCDLVRVFLSVKVARGFDVKEKGCGLIQGSPISPFLSNVYLNGLDAWLTEKGFTFIRFADDIKILVRNFEEGARIFKEVSATIEQDYNLNINEYKSGVFSVWNHNFLGYALHRFGNGKIEIRKRERKAKLNFNRWQTSALKKSDDQYHILTNGILNSKDYNLLFENNDRKVNIPIKTLRGLNVYTDIVFSSNFYSFASENQLPIAFFDKHGNYQGKFVPATVKTNSKLFLEQARVYICEESRLRLAKQFALSAAHNIRENMRYYEKNYPSERQTENVKKITHLMKAEKDAKGINDLMGLEGQIRNIYYQNLNECIKNEDFMFSKRSKRPPTDAINALISFGNVVLYNRIATEIYKSRLDIRFGYLHATNKREESLNLDVAEIFKPIIIDKVIFTLINKRIINVADHFEKLEGGAVYLNKEGKRLFLEQIGSKMMQGIKTKTGYKRYGELINDELRKLAKHFEKGEAYKPYKYFM